MGRADRMRRNLFRCSLHIRTRSLILPVTLIGIGVLLPTDVGRSRHTDAPNATNESRKISPLARAAPSRAKLLPESADRIRGVSSAPMFAYADGTTRGTAPASSRTPVIDAAYGKLPLHFERNDGQTDPSVRYLARGNGYTLFLTADEAVLALKPSGGATAKLNERGTDAAIVRARLVGARKDAQVVGEEPLLGKSNYFIGNDPSKWRTDVPQFSRVTYREVWPGIDLTYYGSNQQELEYDFVVEPGADPENIHLVYEGTECMRIDASGDLILALPTGEVLQKKPLVYQSVDGRRVPVNGEFVLTAGADVSFNIGEFDHRLPLVIDPVLVYSTYLGGSLNDYADAVAVDGTGSVYVTGSTRSTDFPMQGAFQPNHLGGLNEAFVTKLSPSGDAIVFSSYLGGSGDDGAQGVVVDQAGRVYVAGYTASLDYPTASAAQASLAGDYDAFVSVLTSSGSALEYSTYLGGSNSDYGHDIAVDSQANAYVTGQTAGGTFPTASAYQSSYGGGTSDGFITKLSSAGAFVYSTFLGGDDFDYGRGIAVDSAGNAYVTGPVGSFTFPVLDPYQSSYAGSGDAFLTKLSPSGSS